MSKLEKLVDDLSALSVLEAAELSKMLEEKWGVSAAAPVAVAAAGPAAVAEAVEEQTEFTVILPCSNTIWKNCFRACIAFNCRHISSRSSLVSSELFSHSS